MTNATEPKPQAREGGERRVSGADLIAIARDLRSEKDRVKVLADETEARRRALVEATEPPLEGSRTVRQYMAASVAGVRYGVAYCRWTSAEADFNRNLKNTNEELTAFFHTTPHTISVEVEQGSWVITESHGPLQGGLRGAHVYSVTGEVSEVEMNHWGSLLVAAGQGQYYQVDLLMDKTPPTVTVQY